VNADAALEAVLRGVEPAARLVSERHLRKILEHLRDNGRPVPANPALPFWISRADLDDADILDRTVLDGPEQEFLLLTPPDDRMIDTYPPDERLQEYWRLLFRAAVLRAIDRKLADGELSLETCSRRLDHYGPWVAREIRFVLESDHVVDPEADDAARYRAFAAVYLDLLHFRPALIEDFFPSVADERDGITEQLREDVDSDALLAASRPPGSADPDREHCPADLYGDKPVTPAAQTVLETGERAPLLANATAAVGKGNFVRAAILATRAGNGPVAADALGKMVDQLGGVLGWDDGTRNEWKQALAPLLAPASASIWPRAARCLYELQKIPNGLAQEVYAIDLPEYIRTFGGRPVKRHLPRARGVLILMHLKRAHKQLLRTGVPEKERLRLDGLFKHDVHHLEKKIREEFTPIVRAAIDDSGLKPADRVEVIARDKLVAEMLDRVCDKGHLRISDLRDAVARNQLKIPDVKGPGEFFRGNALLRADTRLSRDLDGVYRRGEFYMRWLQRVSSLFFGTPLGRALTLYLLIPFGGALMTLVAIEEVRHLGGKIVSVVSRTLTKKPTAEKVAAPAPAAPQPLQITDNVITDDEIEFDEDGNAIIAQKTITLTLQLFTASPPHQGSVLTAWPTVVGFGVFLLLMIHAPPFRRGVFFGLKYLWQVIRYVLWDLPRGVLHSKFVKSIRRSGPARFANKYLTAAVLISLVVVLVMWALGANAGRLAKWGGITFAVVALFTYTRWGWMLQERVAEAASDRWRLIRVNLLYGLVAGILAFFQKVANWVEQRLYAVDEWLRFRGGDSKGSVVTKAILGLLWFPVAYLTRFSFYLLLEPQVNPVKHFPVVTVSHKLLLPLTVPTGVGEASSFGAVLVAVFGMGITEANVWAFWIIAGIPGIFGFIAWELKENWRLYGANRAKKLRPVTLGSHGESMRGLLRPGFHSGTVPKLFKKMRAADRKNERAAVARLHHDLEHSAEGVQRFAERELIPLLDGSPDWGGVKVGVKRVHFGCLRAVIDLHAPDLSPDDFVLAFENRHGRIEAAVVRRGWFDKLNEAQAKAFVTALQGLLDMAAADPLEGTERGFTATEPDATNPFCGLHGRCDWDGWVVKWRVPEEKKAPPPVSN
jgi:hypothetical protein